MSDAGASPLYDLEPGNARLCPTTRVNGLFDHADALDQALAVVRRRLSPEPLPEYRINVIPCRDWSTAWRDDYRPMRFGERLWVCPPGSEPKGNGVCVLMEPGLAFGSGTHETTAMCLEWLDQAPLEDATVIDYGCGSGILGIAALKLGAKLVWAVDHDPQAIEAAETNGFRNAVGDRLQAVAPENL